MKKNRKTLSEGDVFRFNMGSPEGYLILRVEEFEDSSEVWCEVMKAHYEHEAEDKYEEEDRYQEGDSLPWLYDDEVELVSLRDYNINDYDF